LDVVVLATLVLAVVGATNPNKLRQFARARGVLAKNNRLAVRLRLLARRRFG